MGWGWGACWLTQSRRHVGPARPLLTARERQAGRLCRCASWSPAQGAPGRGPALSTVQVLPRPGEARLLGTCRDLLEGSRLLGRAVASERGARQSEFTGTAAVRPTETKPAALGPGGVETVLSLGGARAVCPPERLLLSTWHTVTSSKRQARPQVLWVLLGWRRISEAARGDPIAVPPGTAKPNPTPAQPVARLPKASFTRGGGAVRGDSLTHPLRSKWASASLHPGQALHRLLVPQGAQQKELLLCQGAGGGAEGCPGGSPVRGLEAGRDKLTRMSTSFY